MANINPNWEEIDQFHDKLTLGEKYISEYLYSNLSDAWDIYIQPFLNGSRPDIVLLSQKYGVIFIEVKDWNLNNYYFQDKTFYVESNNGKHEIRSPIEQVKYYSDNLKSIIPALSTKFKKDYLLIRNIVYFHNSFQSDVDNIFSKEKGNKMLIGIDKLEDDFFNEFIHYNVNSNQDLMDTRTLNCIKYWLNPPYHFKEQSSSIVLNSDQKKHAKPSPGSHRVKGVAGSGKTLVVAHRAAALAADGHKVLIVSFNKTLWHYIRDMVHRAPFNFNRDQIVYNHFHGFCNDILNELSYPKPKEDYLDNIDRFVFSALESAYERNINLETLKFDSILIDEGQDFKAEWIDLLRKFLKGRKELLLVCDEAQNIYKRELGWINEDSLKKGFVGRWGELSKCLRLPKLIAEEANRFLDLYLPDVELHSVPSQTKLFEFDPILKWINCKNENEALDQAEEAYNYLFNEIGQQPTDIIMLFPDKEMGNIMVKRFESKNIHVNDVFSDNHKKSFWMGDSRTKMSTIHSFKGWELKNIIVISKYPFDHHIYTAISRAMENLIVINLERKYHEYGNNWPDTEPFKITK